MIDSSCPHPVVIREVRPEHYSDILTLFSDPDELFYIYPKARHPFLLDQFEYIVETRSDLSVALDGDRVVGFANLYNLVPDRWVFIGNLVVAKGYRGQGIGRKLISYMEELVKSKYRLAEVRISVFNNNTPAMLLYAELGYVPYALEQRESPSGSSIALIHMRKRFH